MTTNICGNCMNFKPKPGERLFNCTSASHAGLNYGMQVRADTRSCDGFVPFTASPAPAPTPPEAHTPSAERLQPVRLCSRGRTIVVVAVAMAVVLLTWLLYSCASNLTTQTTTPTQAPTGVATPAPTPTPVPITYLEAGEWAETSRELVSVVYAWSMTMYRRYGTEEIRAPAGAVFILIEVTVRNNEVTLLNISPDRFILRDSEGRVYTLTLYEDEGGFPTGQLPARGMTTGKVLFTVPKPFSGSGLEVAYNLRGTSPVHARWKLN